MVSGLSGLTVTRANSTTALSSLSLEPGDSVQLTASGTYWGRTAMRDLNSLTWTIEGDVGTITPEGLFTASDQSGAKGTIVKEDNSVEQMLLSGVAKDDNIARISIIGVPDKPGLAYKIFSKLSSRGTDVDIILQSIGRNGTKDISFTVEKDRMEDTIEQALEEAGLPKSPRNLEIVRSLLLNQQSISRENIAESLLKKKKKSTNPHQCTLPFPRR